jgi:hypothetical protein
VLYAAELQACVERHGLTPHLYADDTQIYRFCRPGDVGELSNRLVNCVSDGASWMRSNRLQLIIEKTNLLWCTTSRREYQLPTEALSFGGYDILPSRSLRSLSAYFDADLSLRSHIAVIVARCFATLRQLRGIHRYVAVPVLQTLATSLALTRLGYCNSLLFGLPASQIARIQSVQNASARLMFNLRRSEHISDALTCLHWLRIPERISFKIAILVYRALHGLLPSYLSGFAPLSVTSDVNKTVSFKTKTKTPRAKTKTSTVKTKTKTNTPTSKTKTKTKTVWSRTVTKTSTFCNFQCKAKYK